MTNLKPRIRLIDLNELDSEKQKEDNYKKFREQYLNFKQV